MLKTDVTIFHKVTDREWTRTLFTGCFWQGEIKTKVAERGLVYASQTTVFIPLSPGVDHSISKDDIIIMGDYQADTASSERNLLAHPNSIKIIGVIDNRLMRGLSHLEVVGQ